MNKKHTKTELWNAHRSGKTIEVNCPWWNKNHWEVKKNIKSKSSFWDEANYRIID
jgi:hypothetical protein